MSLSARSDLHDLEMMILEDREMAILASMTCERKDAVWLPKSQIEIGEPCRRRHGNQIVVTRMITVPEWLMIEKGLTEC